jgi:hypothetical protein
LFLPEFQAKKIDNIDSMICQRIHSTGMDAAMAQPHNNHGSVEHNFNAHILWELIEQPDDSFNYLSSFIADIETCMRFSAILTMGGSAIASSSQSIPCHNSNTNSNDITSITEMTSVEITGLLDGSTFVEGAMYRGD